MHKRGDHSSCLPYSLCTKGSPPLPAAAGLPDAPPDLSVTAGRFWVDMTAKYEMSPNELALLDQACRVLDRLGVLDEGLGSMRLDDTRTLLLLKHAAELQRVFATLIAAMALPMPGETEGKARDLRQVMAAQARWSKEAGRGEAAQAG